MDKTSNAEENEINEQTYLFGPPAKNSHNVAMTFSIFRKHTALILISACVCTIAGSCNTKIAS